MTYIERPKRRTRMVLVRKDYEGTDLLERANVISQTDHTVTVELDTTRLFELLDAIDRTQFCEIQ